MSLEPEKWVEVDDNNIGWEMTHTYSSGQTVYDRDHTTRRQLPVVVTNFCCPVCGCKTFEPIVYNPDTAQLHQAPHEVVHGPGSGGDRFTTITITGYRCPGCTLRFEDPVKFSRNQPAEIVPPMAVERDMFGMRAAREAEALKTQP